MPPVPPKPRRWRFFAVIFLGERPVLKDWMAIFLVVMPFSDLAPTFHRRSPPPEDLNRRPRANPGGTRISSPRQNKAAEN